MSSISALTNTSTITPTTVSTSYQVNLNTNLLDSCSKEQLYAMIATRDLQIYQLEQENRKLRVDNSILTEIINNNLLKIARLEEDNKILKSKADKLESKIDRLEKRNSLLEEHNDKLTALVKLAEINHWSNRVFQAEYRQEIKPKRTERIPTLNSYISHQPDPSDPEDKKYYDFWISFKQRHPGADNNEFRRISQNISSDRARSGAHVNVTSVDENEFDKLISIAFPEDQPNKYADYKKFIFSFKQYLPIDD